MLLESHLGAEQVRDEIARGRALLGATTADV